MKTIKFFTLAFAIIAMSLTSCAKDGDTTPNVEIHNAKLTIGIVAPKTLGSRTIGAITGDNDSKINNFLAFTFKANGEIDGAVIESTDGLEVTSADVTTATTEIYVVANAPKDLFTGINTKTKLLEVVGNLHYDGGQTQTSADGGNVWASGSNSVAFTKNPSNVYEATVDVTITFVAARINVTIINNMTNREVLGAFHISQIAMLNVTAATKLFGTSLIPSTKNYHAGIDMTGFENIPPSYTEESFLTDAHAEGTSNHFYVFENDATDFPTILALIASYNGGVSYASLQFDLADAKHVITRGNSYNVTLTFTGSADPNDNENPGTTDPTVPVVSANIKASVTVAAWVPNTIVKEF